MQPVLWTKGVLLTPQHLQTQDRFLEDQLQFQLASLTFCPWGFHRLEINREVLSGGALALSVGTGFFPDGLPFDIPDSDTVPPPRPLEGCWEPDQQTLDVYLAVPEHKPGAANVASNTKGRDTRYTAEVILRRDENTGLGEKPIQVARKNLRLLVEGEALDGYSVLRVARVRRSPAGDYQLDPQFVPPLIDISASEYLVAITRRLVEIISAKSTTLAGTRRQKNQSLAEFSITDVASFWLLYTINTHLPQLRHLLETRRGHPGELFAAMSALAGALTTFSTTLHPRHLPAYEHGDLSTCFTQLDERLRQLLETVVPANCVSLPLKLVQPSVYATAIDQDRYFSAPQLYLAMSAELNHADLLRKVPQLLKVSSADRIDRLIKQALPGVALTHVATPPSAIPLKLKFHYFLLSKAGSEWEAIGKARNLAAYVPSDFPAPELELVVVLPPREG
jgi:type VI secretion system protein ImpJ